MKNIQKYISFLDEKPVAINWLTELKDTPEFKNWYDKNYDRALYDNFTISLSKDGMELQYCKFRDDEKICSIAAVNNILALEYCDPKFLDDENFVLNAYKNYFSNVTNNEHEYHGIRGMYSPFQYCSDKVKNNKEVCLYVASVDEYAFKSLPDVMRDDEEIAFAALNKNARNFEYISQRLKEFPKFYNFALKVGYILDLCPYSVRNNKEFCKEAIKNSMFAYGCCSETLRDDDELALLAMESSSYIFDVCSERLKNDENLIQMHIDRDHFEYCSDSVKNSIKWALMAVEKNFKNYNYCSDELKENKDIVISYLKGIKNYIKGVRDEYHRPLDRSDYIKMIPVEAYDDEDVFIAFKELINHIIAENKGYNHAPFLELSLHYND